MSEPAEQGQSCSLVWSGEPAPLAKALVAAQVASESIKKAATNPHFKAKYADLAGVVEAVVPALNAAGVALIQSPSFDGQLVWVTTTLLHESGASVTGVLGMRPTKPDPQGVGSAITYARRYALLAMTGAAPEDDDGNAASGQRPASDPKADFAIGQLRTCQTEAEFRDFWARNRDGLKEQMTPPEYNRVVEAMREEAKRFAPGGAPDPAPQADASTPFDEKEAA